MNINIALHSVFAIHPNASPAALEGARDRAKTALEGAIIAAGGGGLAAIYVWGYITMIQCMPREMPFMLLSRIILLILHNQWAIIQDTISQVIISKAVIGYINMSDRESWSKIRKPLKNK